MNNANFPLLPALNCLWPRTYIFSKSLLLIFLRKKKPGFHQEHEKKEQGGRASCQLTLLVTPGHHYPAITGITFTTSPDPTPFQKYFRWSTNSNFQPNFLSVVTICSSPKALC